MPASNHASVQTRDLGDVTFRFAVAPHHPLAQAPEPIDDATLQAHRLVVVADSALRDTTSIGLLSGQERLTVSTMAMKLDAQLRGLGCGFLPEAMLAPYVAQGVLRIKAVSRPTRTLRLRYAWTTHAHLPLGQAMRWWLAQLDSPTTCCALLAPPAQPLAPSGAMQAV